MMSKKGELRIDQKNKLQVKKDLAADPIFLTRFIEWQSCIFAGVLKK